MKASLQLKNHIYQVVISYKDVDGKNKTKWVSTGCKEGTGKRKLEEKRKAVLAEFEEMYNRKIYAPQTDKNGFKASSIKAFSSKYAFILRIFLA